MRNKERRSILCVIIVVIFALIAFLVLSNLVKAESTIWASPSSTMSINLTFNETPLINKSVNLTTQLLSIINATNTTANVTLPYSIELITGSTQWDGSLIENITKNLTMTIKVNTTGNFTIEANARDPPSGTTYMGAREFIYLEVTDTNTIVSDVPALNSSWNYTKYSVQINTTSEPPSLPENSTSIQSTDVLPNHATVNLSVLRPLINDTFNETNFTNGSNEITVKGRFVFENR